MADDVTRSWHPNYILKNYFGQGEHWLAHDSSAVKIADMPREYALNCIAMLERCREDIEDYQIGEHLHRTELYKALRARTLETTV